jgi:NAD(P)H-nitrite reductase large subunit
MNILIIGNSAAGTAAIEAIRRYDQKSFIIQLSDEPHPLYSRCLLSYYLSDAISKKALQYRDTDFHEKMQVQLHVGQRAVELDTNQQQVMCNDGSVYPFDRLLISTGSSAKLPDNIPKGIEGVCVLRTIDDVEIIRKKVKQAKNAVVLGGGLIGMKAACALSECGLEIKVVVRSNRVLSQMIDTEASQFYIKRLLESKIEVLKQTDVSEIQSKKNKLMAVKTDQGQVIPCELLIVAKGVQPNTELIQGTDIKKRRGIETNPFMQTSHKNIFAAGDVAETFDITTEEYAVNALWTCAVQQGRIAGLNMIDKTSAYDGTIGMNSLNVCGLPLISYGITSPKNESTYQILVLEKRESAIYKKIVLKDHRIKGIILLGKIDNAGVLLSLIQRKADVSSFEDELLSDQFNFSKLVGYSDPSVFEKYQKC